MGRQKRLSAIDFIREALPVVTGLDVGGAVKTELSRPKSGWLRSVRQLYGLSLNEIAARRKITPQVLLRAEIAEVEERITVKNLRLIADAMGFDLIYTLVPREVAPLDALRKRLEEVSLSKLDPTVASMVRELQKESQELSLRRTK